MRATESSWHLADEKGIIGLALLVYVPRKESLVVDSYACRDLQSFQHTLYVHLGVLSAVKIVTSYWCAHKNGAHVCGGHHYVDWSGSHKGFPVPDGISH